MMQLTFIIDPVENKFCYMLIMFIISVSKFYLHSASPAFHKDKEVTVAGINSFLRVSPCS